MAAGACHDTVAPGLHVPEQRLSQPDGGGLVLDELEQVGGLGDRYLIQGKETGSGGTTTPQATLPVTQVQIRVSANNRMAVRDLRKNRLFIISPCQPSGMSWTKRRS